MRFRGCETATVSALSRGVRDLQKCYSDWPWVRQLSLKSKNICYNRHYTNRLTRRRPLNTVKEQRPKFPKNRSFTYIIELLRSYVENFLTMFSPNKTARGKFLFKSQLNPIHYKPKLITGSRTYLSI